MAVQAASIVVESPAGGEKWRLKETRHIQWRAEGVSGELRITLWKDEVLLGDIAHVAAQDGEMVVWSVGRYNGGWALPGGGYKIKVKQRGVNVSGMSARAFEILKEEDETDLSLSGCVMRNRAGEAVSRWRKGDIAKVEFTVHAPADLPCFKFLVKAQSIRGQAPSAGMALSGKSGAENLFLFTPPWTEKAGFLYMTIDEEGTGPFTLLLGVTSVSPKKDIDPRNNQCRIPFEIALNAPARLEIQRKNADIPGLEFRPNLKVSYHNRAPDWDSFNVLIENENYKVAKINQEVLVYARFDVVRNITGRGWVNFETYVLKGVTLESLNRGGVFYVGFFGRGWVDASATTCTVTVDSRNAVAETNEDDNQCTIRFD